ncbi:MAG: DEAD/DEAH box helicase family protein, partial [Solirubrobacterales bacterium]
MADTTALAATAADAPTGADLERVQKFTREPILLEGETFEQLPVGSARRQAYDSALAEIEEGLEEPSPDWRRSFSLLLGLERVLAEDPPLLRDGAELSEHQVDALSGTLAAIISETEEPGSFKAGNGNGSSSSNGGSGPAAEDSDEDDDEEEEESAAALAADAKASAEEEADAEELEKEEIEEDEEPLDWSDEDEEDEEVDQAVLDDPNAARRFWFEHATGAGKTVAAMGFVEASRTGGTLILTHRRNLVDQFNDELRTRGYADRISPPLLGAEHNLRADGPVTVETYQWFVRNAGQISAVYTVVI